MTVLKLMESKQMFAKKSDSGYLEPAKGVQLKTLVYGEKTHLCEFKLKKGSALPAHSHPHEQTGYLVSGSLKFRIGDEVFDAAEGDSWNIPGGMEHAVQILEDSVVVEVFSPLREEYL